MIHEMDCDVAPHNVTVYHCGIPYAREKMPGGHMLRELRCTCGASFHAGGESCEYVNTGWKRPHREDPHA